MRSKLRFGSAALFAVAHAMHAQGPVVVQHHITTGGTSVTLPNPAKAGNLLIAGVDFFSGYGLVTPAGWTLIGSETNGNWGATFYSHVSVAGESSTYDFPSTGNSVDMYEVAGYNAAAPINLLTGALGGGSTGATTTVTTSPGTPTVASTLALAWFSPDVQINVTGAGAGWSFDGCDYRRYNTLCSATRQALTSDTTTPIQTTFSVTGTFSGNYTMLILVAPGTAGVIPLATPVPSVAAGVYAGTQTVSLSQAAGAPIHYTMDNSTPTCASPLYSSPLVLDATYTINALACDATGNTSVGFSGYYLIGPGTLKGMALGPLADLNGFVPFASSTPDEWQTDISGTAVNPNSAAVLSLLVQDGFKNTVADTTMPYVIVDSRKTALQEIVSLPDPNYLTQSDVTMAPIPPNVTIEELPPANCANTGDNHVVLLDRATGFATETWHFRWGCSGSSQYQADNISIFDLNLASSVQRPWNYTSADAGGLSVFQGTGRYEEYAAGDVKHALRMTLPVFGYYSKNGSHYGYYIGPARHSAPTGGQQPTDTNLIAYGQHIRLKPGYTNSACSSVISTRMITQLQHYGLIFADQGNIGQVQFTPDARWASADLACFDSIPSSAFEVIQPNPSTPLWYGTNSQYPLDPSSVATNQGVVIPAPMQGVPIPVLTSASASASTISLGQCVTLSATFTGAKYAYWDKAGPTRSGENQLVCPTTLGAHVFTLTVQPQSLRGDDGSGDGYTDAISANGRLFKSVTVTVGAASATSPASVLDRLIPRGRGAWRGYKAR